MATYKHPLSLKKWVIFIILTTFLSSEAALYCPLCILTDLSPFAACAPTNVITLTLAPSVPIYHRCLPFFVIAGLTGAATEDNEALALINKPANLVLQTAASWTRDTGRLMVNLTETDQHPMEAGVPYEFSINLTNGIAAQPSPVQIVVDLTLFTGTQNMTGDESVPLNASNIYLPVAGDLLPLYIRTVVWVVRHMGQTSPYRKSALLPATVWLSWWFSSIIPP